MIIVGRVKALVEQDALVRSGKASHCLHSVHLYLAESRVDKFPYRTIDVKVARALRDRNPVSFLKLHNRIVREEEQRLLEVCAGSALFI